jgi:DNA integrity scanning protein DisA with diadenylate cyclase activity
MRRTISERLQLIAQYASIDGALILSDLLDMVSFGTKLSADTWSEEVLIGPDGFHSGGEQFEYDRFGTRHKSAIDFVGENEAAIVFVISQDGPIRGFAKRNQETILCWPDCTVSMFI